MKINVIGSKCTWHKDLSTSFMINDEILVDLPEGSFKTLYVDYDIFKVKYVMITHFHADHFGELHLLINVLNKAHKKNDITIIAPKNCKEHLIYMFKAVESTFLKSFLEDHVTFIDAENNKIIKLGDYKIKCYKMLHEDIDAFGYVVENNGKTVGFTGDTAMCNNVRKILKKSELAFVDSGNLVVSNNHLCIGEVNELSKEFTNCKICAVHLGPFSLAEIKNTDLYHPKQGEIFEI